MKYKNIETLVVGSITYTEDASVDSYWNSSEYVLYLYDGGNAGSSDITGLSGFTASSNLSIVGSGSGDTLNLNIDRSSTLTGNLTLTLGAGNDTLNSAKLKNGDSIDLGAGDDGVSLMLTGSNGTPTIAAASLTKLDGGVGTDTLKFEESGANTTALTLTTAGATNFENLTGTSGAETLTGDANANVLKGLGGVDTLYGLGGNDTLNAAGSPNCYGSTNDLLYGGAGDDTLLGSAGENTLDGGTGKDTLQGCDGVDTFVIRAGDGNTTLADADVLTDFADGTDLIGLNGLNYSDLTISQGTGDYLNHVVVKYGTEFLIVIQNTNVSNITDLDFTPI
ncbi:hypothetical protein OAL14_00875 [Gammaproteobacteria bacterium]|nr:hypothetical protein [Gammaproteobacteria bacterium]